MCKAEKFKKILIANRGEIAVRIVRACKELNIKTVSVYSDVDKNSLSVNCTAESYHISRSVPIKSHLLNIERFKMLNIKLI